MGPILVAVLLYVGGASSDGRAASSSTGRAAIVAALKARGLLVVDHAVDEAVKARRDGWRTVDELGFFTRGKKALDDGRRARERVELEVASRLFADAEAAYAEGAGAAGIGALSAEAALEHGVTLGELGRPEEARAAFARALALSPRLTLTERHARPDVVRLFREVARTRHGEAPAQVAEPRDGKVETLLSLRSSPSTEGAAALVDALDLDAALVLVASADGRRVLGARVRSRCATEVVELDVSKLDAGLGALLERPCTERALALKLDDPRLEPPPPVALPVAKPRPRRKAWPYAVAGALGAAAAIVGVTVGVVVSDPRYSLRVNGADFGGQ